jgi:sentrin-specific protease 7
VHVFNSFFWNRLTSKSANLNGKAGQVSIDMIIYLFISIYQGAVRSWTKDVNIFDKDFVLIPINEDAHW